jgi:predicted molibdopterin-dependent oxidoreductase YjgC
MFMSPTAELSHCVFPVVSFAEKEGTMTNIEHRVQRLAQVIPPLGPTMPDWSILEELAKTMGHSMGYFSASDVFREITQTVPLYKGISPQDLEGNGKILRPFSTSPERLFNEKPFSFAPVRTWEAPDKDAADYPFEMVVGRSMYHFGSTSTRSMNLLGLCPCGNVEINPDDASELGLKQGDLVEVMSPQGAFKAPAEISYKISRGLIFVPVNFPGLGVYRLFDENTNVCRVKLSAPGKTSYA